MQALDTRFKVCAEGLWSAISEARSEAEEFTWDHRSSAGGWSFFNGGGMEKLQRLAR